MRTLSFLSLAAVAALAADNITLEKIAVEETALSADVSASQLSTKKSTSMSGDTASLLADLPGVSVYQTGGSASLPAIHGMADDRIKITVDGVAATAACPNHMNAPLSYIDSTKVGTIEVMAGITPVSAGGDSIAGTIAVKTKDPVFAGTGEVAVNGEIAGFYRSNSQSHGGSLNATAANDTISFNYSGYAEKADNYRTGDGKTVKGTLYQQQNHQATLAYKLSDGYAALKVAKTNVDFMGFPNQYMDMLGNESTSANLIYKGKAGALLIDANAYHQNVDHYMNKILSERTGNMPMYTEAKESGANIAATLPYSSAQTFKFGAEYNRFRLNDWWPADTVNNMAGMNPNTFWSINDGKRDRLGIFAEAQSQWSDKLSTNMGVRYNRIAMDTGDVVGYNSTNNDPVDQPGFNAANRKKTDDNIDVTAVAKYEYDATMDLEFGFARKTRSPNLYERFAWAGNALINTGPSAYPTDPKTGMRMVNPILMDMRMINWFGDANGYVGNLNLDPETAHTISATLALHDAPQKEWAVKFTPYFTKVKNFIDIDAGHAYTAADGRRYFQFVNTDAHLFGADLSGYMTLWDNAENGKGILRGNAGVTRGFRDNGGSLYHMMPVHAKVSFDRISGPWSNGIDLKAVASKKAVDTLRKEPETAGYAIVDLRTGYAWTKQLNMDFSVTNLFDKAYALPLGGVDLVNYANTSYTPLQGIGRSLNAALSYKF